jgi:hypothetical protein
VLWILWEEGLGGDKPERDKAGVVFFDEASAASFGADCIAAGDYRLSIPYP